MNGFYFVNSDIANKRAHTFQMLNSAAFIDSLKMIFPRYRSDYDKKELFA